MASVPDGSVRRLSSGFADDATGRWAAIVEWGPGSSGADPAARGDGLPLCFSEERACPGVVAREDEESGQRQRNSGDDGKDAAGDAHSQQEPSQCDLRPSASPCRSPVHAH